jgi:hypothetical protein
VANPVIEGDFYVDVENLVKLAWIQKIIELLS